MWEQGQKGQSRVDNRGLMLDIRMILTISTIGIIKGVVRRHLFLFMKPFNFMM